METGIIARLTDKGFGFIKREGEEKDLFFHSNELVGVAYDDLREGDTVQFEVAQGEKGLNAVKVSPVTSDDSNDSSDDNTDEAVA